jgi:excisionase family DNA binding protein
MQPHRTFSIMVPRSDYELQREELPLRIDPKARFALMLDTIARQIADRVEADVLDRLAHMPPQIQPMLLSVKDAAVYLGRSEQSIQHLIFSKELPVVRVGRRVHLDRRDLDAWIEKNKY